MKKEVPVVIDLFCGTGGLSEGFRQAGFKSILGIDIDKSALETFALNHKGAETICGDISKITKEQIIENFCSWGPLFKIPKNLKNDFLEDFFMNFSEMLPPPVDEKYPYPIRLIYIKASK